MHEPNNLTLIPYIYIIEFTYSLKSIKQKFLIGDKSWKNRGIHAISFVQELLINPEY